MELARTILEMKSTVDILKDEQKLIESAFEEKQNELRMMQENGRNLVKGGSERIALRDKLKQKEAETEDLKHRLETSVNRVSIDDHPTILDQIVVANRAMEIQNRTQNDNPEKDEKSRDSSKDGEVTAEIKDKIRTNEELGKKNEDPHQDDGSAGANAKDIEAGVVEDRGKKAIREESQGQLQSIVDGGRHDFNAKQLSGMKRKHGHLSRTKGRRWRTVVKNKLMENNGIFESHEEVNMGDRKVYREEKDGTVGRNSDEKKITREDEGTDGNNQREAESVAELLKIENYDNEEDGISNNTTVDKTNNQVIEEREDSSVQQNWSGRRINNSGETKSKIFNEEHEELEVSGVQKQDKDAIDGDDDDKEDNKDDFLNESHREFEDENEKEEYKEEIDESEFQFGL